MREKWEQAYEDWVKLLKAADAMDLLEDPKAIWDEAFRQASMIAIESARASLFAKDNLDLVKVLEERLL